MWHTVVKAVWNVWLIPGKSLEEPEVSIVSVTSAGINRGLA